MVLCGSCALIWFFELFFTGRDSLASSVLPPDESTYIEFSSVISSNKTWAAAPLLMPPIWFMRLRAALPFDGLSLIQYSAGQCISLLHSKQFVFKLIVGTKAYIWSASSTCSHLSAIVSSIALRSILCKQSSGIWVTTVWISLRDKINILVPIPNK